MQRKGLSGLHPMAAAGACARVQVKWRGARHVGPGMNSVTCAAVVVGALFASVAWGQTSFPESKPQASSDKKPAGPTTAELERFKAGAEYSAKTGGDALLI